MYSLIYTFYLYSEFHQSFKDDKFCETLILIIFANIKQFTAKMNILILNSLANILFESFPIEKLLFENNFLHLQILK